MNLLTTHFYRSPNFFSSITAPSPFPPFGLFRPREFLSSFGKTHTHRVETSMRRCSQRPKKCNKQITIRKINHETNCECKHIHGIAYSNGGKWKGLRTEITFGLCNETKMSSPIEWMEMGFPNWYFQQNCRHSRHRSRTHIHTPSLQFNDCHLSAALLAWIFN